MKEILHGLSNDAYRKVLEGKPQKYTMPRGMLRDVERPAAIQDASESVADQQGEAPFDLLAALEELLSLEEPPRYPPPLPPPNSLPAEQLPRPQPPPPLAGHQPVRIAGRPGRPGRGSRWGPFLLTYKAAGKGSWQATCPWHRGTEVNPRCKKTITVRAQGEDDLTIRRLRQWCLLAARPDIITKTQHLKVELPGETPSHEQLEDELAHLPPPPPWEDVLPEEALLLMLDDKASSSGSSSSSSGSSSSSTMSD